MRSPPGDVTGRPHRVRTETEEVEDQSHSEDSQAKTVLHLLLHLLHLLLHVLLLQLQLQLQVEVGSDEDREEE